MKSGYYYLCLLLACSWLTLLPSDPGRAVKQTRIQNPKQRLCSQQDLNILLPLLMRDLPNYANRVSQRARRKSRAVDFFSYVLIAGNPEFAPLKVDQHVSSSSAPAEPIEQVFFTTLERQYTANKPVQIQQFHRLLLTKSQSGWIVVMMFSQLGTYPVKLSPTPPRDSNNSIIAQAVNLWLRDCQAGEIRSD
jgi:hypothetical protein